MTPSSVLCWVLVGSVLALTAGAPLKLDEDTLARRRQRAHKAEIYHLETIKSGDGDYTLTFSTENGISQQERGVSYPGIFPESGTYVKEGTIEYELPDGQLVTLEYLADENGFEVLNPEALERVLPTPPPTQYPLPRVPGAGMAVPAPLPEFNTF